MSMKKLVIALCVVALVALLCAGCVPVPFGSNTQGSSAGSSTSSSASSAVSTTNSSEQTASDAQASLTTNAASATPASTYMNSVKGVFSSIQENMATFTKAVSAKDAQAARTVLDEVDSQVSKLSDISVPDGLDEVQKNYVQASKDLAQALRDYVTYKLDGGASASDAASALANIQSAYQKGIDALKAADNAAKSL